MHALESAGPATCPDVDVWRSICRNIRLVESSLRRRIDRHMRPLDLTGMQWEPVLSLWLRHAQTVAALAHLNQVGLASMSRMLDRLEDKGLLSRERSDEDRRMVRLRLTPKGRAAAARIWPIVVEGMAMHLSGFRADELAGLNEMLARMLANGTCALPNSATPRDSRLRVRSQSRASG